MVEFTDMKGQELVDIKESEDKLELFFKNNIGLILFFKSCPWELFLEIIFGKLF